MNLTYIGFGITLIWLIALSFFLFKLRAHYFRLTTRTGGGHIDEILDNILKTIDEHSHSIDESKKGISLLEKDTAMHFQKIGYVKFNPFDRVGGDQSFVVALLDKGDNGMVTTFLYTREGVRIYAKPVKSGVGTEFTLSEEEKEAIKKAE